MRTIIIVCMVATAVIAIGEDSSYYRIVSGTNSAIVGFASPGYLTWSNAAGSGTASVQTVQGLTNDWRDYTAIVVTSMQARAASRGNDPSGMCFVPYGSFWRGDSFGEGNVDEMGVASTTAPPNSPTPPTLSTSPSTTAAGKSATRLSVPSS